MVTIDLTTSPSAVMVVKVVDLISPSAEEQANLGGIAQAPPEHTHNSARLLVYGFPFDDESRLPLCGAGYWSGGRGYWSGGRGYWSGDRRRPLDTGAAAEGRRSAALDTAVVAERRPLLGALGAAQ